MRNSRSLIALMLILLFSCGGGTERDLEEVVEVTYESFPQFNADSAYAFIQKQVDFGPRVPNSPGHTATGKWLMEKFESYGLEVQGQEFTASAYDGKVLELTNIIASFKPEMKRRVILAAHWDTRRVADKDTERIN